MKDLITSINKNSLSLTKKLLLFILCSVLFIICCFSVISDNLRMKGNVSVFAEEIDPNVCEVWSAPSSVKIRQEQLDYNDKGNASLSYDMVKNEYESNQLLITAKKNINYDLKAVDLIGSNGKINKENIEIYNEKYVFTTDSMLFGYVDGSYPDALIPIEYARNAEELNVDANNNGALWVTIYIPSDTPSGVYSGNFTLTVDNVDYLLPVSVNVREYTLTDDTNNRIVFSNRWGRHGDGELNSSNAINEAYYEFMLDYRISLQCLPVETLTGEEMVYYVDKYFDKMSAYSILNISTNIWGEFNVHVQKMHEEILALAKASTPKRNLLSKAVFYFIDEPELSNTNLLNRYIKYLKQLNGMLQDCAKLIELDDTGIYDSFKSMSNWKSSIIDIMTIVTVNNPPKGYFKMDNFTGEMTAQNTAIAEFLSLIDTLCPIFTFFDDSYREEFMRVAEYFDCNIIWYGCVGPKAPYATYHITDPNLLSSRTNSWLQNKYDVLGNLYWDTSGYRLDESRTLDVYKNPYMYDNVEAGDGILTYPGAKYGHYGAFPSMRLMSIRDGLEDFEMLLSAEEKINGLSDKYGETINVDSTLNLMYNRLSYSGAMYYAENEAGLVFSEVREALFSIIEENSVGFILEDVETQDGDFIISFYADNKYEVYVNNVIQTQIIGSEFHYSMTIPSADNQYIQFRFVNKTNSSDVITKNVYLGRPTIILNDFNYSSKNSISGITVTEGSQFDVNENHVYTSSELKNSLKINLTSIITGKVAVDVLFKPEVKFSKDAFSKSDFSFEDVLSIIINVYNAGDDCEATVRLYSGSSGQDFTTVTLKSGWNTVTVSTLGTSFNKLADTDTISLRFKNDGTIEAPKGYTLYVDNMSVIMK